MRPAAVGAACAVAVAMWAGSAAAQMLRLSDFGGHPYSVSYDKRSLQFTQMGTTRRSVVLSGSVHPPRFVSQAEWGEAFKGAHDAGLNAVQVYTFWNYHSPTAGDFFWDGVANLTAFVEQAAASDLFVVLRVGPYVCAEWNYGAIPVWVAETEGLQFRCTNGPWQAAMKTYFDRIINNLGGLYAEQGGPIIAVQVENELHSNDNNYVQWCGTMAAAALQNVASDVPILMCNGESATNTINTCNGLSCTSFIESHGQNGRVLEDQPPMWTEMEGGFQIWGSSPTKPTSYFWGASITETAFNVAQWFARGGSHVNFYMFAPALNFGRWAGASVTQAYAMDSPVCPDGLVHTPKMSHLALMHDVLAQYSDVLLYDDAQLGKQVVVPWFNNATGKFENGTQQTAYVYNYQGQSLTFIESVASVPVLVLWRTKTLAMEPNSILFVDGGANVLWNSAVIESPLLHRTFTDAGPVPLEGHFLEPRSLKGQLAVNAGSKDYTTVPDQSVVNGGLSDFAIYFATFSTANGGQGDKSMSLPTGAANGFVVTDEEETVIAILDDHSHSVGNATLTTPANKSMVAGLTTVAYFSENLGYGNFFGPASPKLSKGLRSGNPIVTAGVTLPSDTQWTVFPQLAGETLGIAANPSAVTWTPGPTTSALAWMKASFDTPTLEENSRLLLNATGLGRGHFFVNGFDLGRYWTLPRSDDPSRATQTYYPIPTTLLSSSGPNSLIFFDSIGATVDPTTQPRLAIVSLAPGAPTPPSGGWSAAIHDCEL